ncbi:MAG: hypothetical protein ACYTGZ_13675 [Planctomycetota bacterium]
MRPVAKLHAISRSFGVEAARRKLRLLDEIAGRPLPKSRELRLLDDTLGFIRAYPDNAAVRKRAAALAALLPDADNVYAYSYAVLLRLVRRFPERLEIEWGEIEDDSPILDVVDLLVGPGESQGLEDLRISLPDWIDRSKPPGKSDLEFLLDLFEQSPLPPPVRVFLFENADIPVRYRAPARSALTRTPKRVHYQRRDVERERFPVEPIVRRPIGPFVRGGQGLIDFALQSLCARQLEIYPLIYANPEDVVLVDCGRGLQVLLVGVLPEWRSALESLHFFLILKNGVPVGYGPAAVFLGCCEMGINLFPEFRRGEIRFLYAQFMRVLHERLGVDYFFLTRYAMGEGNPDAIRSGAFWFYRKLGFRPTSNSVEQLALEEEARMRARPGHRSDRSTLRRLSHTEAYLDLSDGRCRPFDFGRFGLALSRFIAASFDSDRALAEKRCSARVRRMLGAPDGPSLRMLAPALSMIPDLPTWSRRDKAALARLLKAKDARSEARAAQLFKSHARLEKALRSIE